MSTTTAPGTWRSLPRTVWVLVLARAVNRLGAFTLPFLAVVLVQELGASVREAGWLLAAFGLATIPSRLLGGRLADRWGARTTILVGLLGTGAAQLWVAGSQTLLQAGVGVVALGLAFELYEPPSQAMVADVTTPGQRPIAYGLLAAALAVAGTAAGLLAALLTGLGLRWLLVVDAATCLACAAVVAALLPRRRGDTSAADDVGTSPWSDRRLLVLLALGTVFAVVYLQVGVTLPLTVAALGHDPAVVGVLLTVSAATMVLGQPLLTRPRVRAMPDVTAMTVGYAVLGAGLLLNGLVTSVPGLVAATVLWSLGDLLLLGRALTLVAGLAPEGLRGRYLAAYGTSWGAAAVVAPLLGTQLLAAGGPRLAWLVVAVLCAGLAAAQPGVARVLRTGR